jgi:hypothetical protein
MAQPHVDPRAHAPFLSGDAVFALYRRQTRISPPKIYTQRFKMALLTVLWVSRRLIRLRKFGGNATFRGSGRPADPSPLKLRPRRPQIPFNGPVTHLWPGWGVGCSKIECEKLGNAGGSGATSAGGQPRLAQAGQKVPSPAPPPARIELGWFAAPIEGGGWPTKRVNGLSGCRVCDRRTCSR